MSFNILIVCTGNICRSPMAEVLLLDMLPKNLKGKIAVSSAGTNALDGNHATHEAIKVMKSYNIDLSRHEARLLNDRMMKDADWVLVMERIHLMSIGNIYPEDKDKAILLRSFINRKKRLDVPDPYGAPLKVYQDCAMLIKDCLENVVVSLAKELSS